MTDIRDVYRRITGKIIADLEQGVRPWHKPWNAEHVAGRITRPLRHNAVPYKGINVVMLVVSRRHQGLRLSAVAHPQAGPRAGRAFPQGRGRRAGGLCRSHPRRLHRVTDHGVEGRQARDIQRRRPRAARRRLSAQRATAAGHAGAGRRIGGHLPRHGPAMLLKRKYHPLDISSPHYRSSHPLKRRKLW
jgi:hypothetical protein